MSQPNRVSELMEVSEAFWDGETEQVRASILIAAGFVMDSAIEKFPFHCLSKQAQRAVARQIGAVLADK